MSTKIVGVDTETTGLDPSEWWTDLIQVAFIVLKPDFTPDKTFPPFYMVIKPSKYNEAWGDQKKIEYKTKIEPALNVNKLKLDDLLTKGTDPIKAAELFDEWWQRLGSSQLELLAQNYPFDKAQILSWLGSASYNQFFSRYYRDTYGGGHFLNDRARYFNDKVPFPDGLSLTKIAKALGIENPKAHDAFSDVLTTAEAYKRMLTYMPVSLSLDQRKKPDSTVGESLVLKTPEVRLKSHIL